MVELDSQENPGEIKRKEVKLDPQENPGEIKRKEVKLDPQENPGEINETVGEINETVGGAALSSVKEVGPRQCQLSNFCTPLIAVSTAVWSRVTKTVSES